MRTLGSALCPASATLGHLLLFSLLLASFAAFVDAQECSKSTPCKVGCCSKWGFCGYGKDYCHKDICVNNCDSKAQCDPGGFGKDYVEQSKCALNVCCSEYGFCGFTEDFCGSKKVKPPSCKSHSLQRVVGYYEGWAANRPCNAFLPEQIPVGVYTHLNFAFASIDPFTYEVRPASQADTRLYRRLTSLKRIDPDLKVLIAIGGWTFNDPGPTATTFSDIARSESAQRAFIKSLISFMSTYDFDGVDLDWEYPGAEDRSGRGEDFENFPKFLANLKSALRATGGRDEVTLTLPASFWYLQHFDIVKLEKHVDFFNIMSYDLHGTWDLTNKWVGPYLNAHTNLTEIKEAMNLLWRNNIDPSKVVLGTGLYGRAFTASSSSCLSPGCTYISGAPRQPCSNEVSVMIQSEIVDVMKRTGRKPTLDKEAAVKILTFDSNKWVAFDDEDTLLMRADFAREQCLGGLMVWAVSQDVPDATYSRALGTAAGRKFTSIINVGIVMPSQRKTIKKKSQCKWTNCGQNCPSGWIRMKRNDKEARKNEFMIDGSDCSWGYHQLCCPPEGKTPTCGWYQHNNGKCNPQCPSGSTEVGSLSKHCNNSKYQAACCTTGESPMSLYDQCGWKEAPMCMLGKCSGSEEEVASSPSGSGGAVCNVEEYNYSTGSVKIQERKYCCDQKGDEEKWADCKWYNNLGPGNDDERYCRSGCPDDRVRVAKDHTYNIEKNGKSQFGCSRGARAKCCLPQKYATVSRDSSRDELLRDALSGFLKDPTCTSSGWSNWGGFSVSEASIQSTSEARNASEPLPVRGQQDGHGSRTRHMHRHRRHLTHVHPSGSRPHAHHDDNESSEAAAGKVVVANHQSRQFGPSFDEREVRLLVADLVLGIASVVQLGIWNDLVPKKYKALKWENIESWIDEEGAEELYGPSQLIELITCDMEDLDDWVGGSQQERCICDTPACCPLGGDYCTMDDTFSGGGVSSSSSSSSKGDVSLQNIAVTRSYYIRLPSGRTVLIWSETYYTSGDDFWHDTHPIRDNVYVMPEGNCLDVQPRITRVSKATQSKAKPSTYHIEHIIELNTIARFFTAAISGTLLSGGRFKTPALDSSITDTLRSEYQSGLDPVVGNIELNSPERRIFNALGSTANTRTFVMTQAGVNFAKTTMWQQDTEGPAGNQLGMSDARMESALEDSDNLDRFLQALQTAIVGVNYLRQTAVWDNLRTINRELREELETLQILHNEANNSNLQIVAAWDEFFADLLRETVDYMQAWVRRWHDEAVRMYGRNTDDRSVRFIRTVRRLLALANDVSLPLEDLGSRRD